jgi:hypothetical protein
VNFKIGSMVRISNGDCRETKERFSMPHPMPMMRGKVYKVENCQPNDNVTLKSYTWDIRDVFPAENEQKKFPEPKLFNIDELEI